MTNKGLSVSSVVSVDVVMAPKAAAERDFGIALILGASDTIDADERLRLYDDVDTVASDFGTESPEYRMAVAYFSAEPSAAQCYIGRWVKTATGGLLKGRILGTAEQNVAEFQAISDGGFSVTVDGVEKSVASVNLASVTNLNGVASAVSTALGATASCVFDGSRFVIRSKTTGSESTVTGVTKTALSTLMGLDADTVSITGTGAESLLDAVTTLADMSSDWYGLLVAEEADDDAIVETADFINATSTSRIAGFTVSKTTVLDAQVENDLASRLKAKGNNRAFVQYSSGSLAPCNST